MMIPLLIFMGTIKTRILIMNNAKALFFYNLVYIFFVGWFFFKPKLYWASVGLSISVACLTIVTVFYLYTFLFGEDILWIDIALFLLAVCLGFLTFYKLCQHKPALFWQALGYMFLFVWVLLYALCTIYAPNTFLFF